MSDFTYSAQWFHQTINVWDGILTDFSTSALLATRFAPLTPLRNAVGELNDMITALNESSAMILNEALFDGADSFRDIKDRLADVAEKYVVAEGEAEGLADSLRDIIENGV